MQDSLAQYRRNTKRASDLVGLAATLSVQTTQALDTSDLLRSAIVLAVSAFDHLIHEVVRVGMLEIARGERVASPGYSRFPVALGVVQTMLSQPLTMQGLDAEIRARHGWQSFQDPDKIAEAIRNISAKNLWVEVGMIFGVSSKEIKIKIKLIVDRRNKIAHEADMDPTVPGARWPIDVALVAETLDFLDSVASAIVTVVSTP